MLRNCNETIYASRFYCQDTRTSCTVRYAGRESGFSLHHLTWELEYNFYLGSSIGRAAASKAEGCGFNSYPGCNMEGEIVKFLIIFVTMVCLQVAAEPNPEPKQPEKPPVKEQEVKKPRFEKSEVRYKLKRLDSFSK